MEPDLTIQEYFAGLSKTDFSLPKSGLTDMTHIDMIPYLRPLQKGESVFMGNLAPVDGKKVTGEVFSMSSAGYRVIFESDRIFDHITFWSNHRVACIEPFISYCLESGEEFEWTYKFRIM